MNTMPKQQYLSRDDKGWKLRRRVPEHLKAIAGKTQWVKRLSGISHKDACAEAKTFGVWTDTQIKQLEAQLRQNAPTKADPQKNEPGFKFELTDHEIDQIAIAYFYELEQSVKKRGG